MVKKALLLGVSVVFILGLSGCATTRKNSESEIQGLRSQVSALETQLQEKDNELNSMRDSLAKIGSEAQGDLSSEVKNRPNGKLIQTALKNAGYYLGDVDGKMGKNTRQAVRDFQKANNLKVDGKVGKGTWEVLKTYLDKKVK